MDERTDVYNEGSNFEQTQAPEATEATAEVNAPAPETPVSEQPEQKAKKKGPKDFTPEEAKALLARAAKVDLSRAAKEFNTSWQAIMSLQKAEAAAKAQAKKKGKKKIEAPKKIKRSEEFTKKEKEDILEKARKLGFREVAAEVGTNWQTLAYWNKHQRLTGSVPEDVEKPAPKPKAKAKVKAAAATKAKKTEKAATAVKASTATKAVKASDPEALEIENAILKEKLAILTQQVDKLRAAVGSLA